ncbi:MAG: hypothetical protein IJX39_01205 [Clostridia bacterium]|nr:hypothetical protein [Clostridia bacterium]
MDKKSIWQNKNLRYLILLVVNSVLFFAVYRILLFYAEMTDKTFWSFVVMVLYLALLLGFVLGYLIYNRFLYRKGLTREQLPAEWSEEQKTSFLADGARRLERSKWMITIIFPLIVTFFIDAVDLFIIDTFFR